MTKESSSSGYIKSFGYLMAAQTEAVTFCAAAWYSAQWLNEHHKRLFFEHYGWEIITFSIAILGIAHSFYLVIRLLLRMDKKKGDSKNV